MEKIRQVMGNVMRLGIPLSLRTVRLPYTGQEHTDSDFLPDASQPINVSLTCGAKCFPYTATIDENNVLAIKDNGTLPVGTYGIEVKCTGTDGTPLRYKVNAVVQIVDSTCEACVDWFDGVEGQVSYPILTKYRTPGLVVSTNGVTITEGEGFAGVVLEERSGDTELEVTDNNININL